MNTTTKTKTIGYQIGQRCAQSDAQNGERFYDAKRILEAHNSIDERTVKSADFKLGYIETIKRLRKPAPSKAAEIRIWKTCKVCNSATLQAFINPESGLCKVCDAKRLEKAVYIPGVKTLQDENSQALEDMGLDQVRHYDADGQVIAEADLANHEVFFDAEGNETEGPEGQFAHGSGSKKNRLEAEADKILSLAEQIEAAQAKLNELESSTDMKQIMMNKARKTAGLPLRSYKDAFHPATIDQCELLVRMRWEESVIDNALLTVTEASLLISRTIASFKR